jgi:hypothetical protein
MPRGAYATFIPPYSFLFGDGFVKIKQIFWICKDVYWTQTVDKFLSIPPTGGIPIVNANFWRKKNIFS